MNRKLKKIIIWIATILGGILFIYLIFFIISVMPAIIFFPIIIYGLVKESGWAEMPLYSKLVIICGGLIFIGIILETFGIFKWIGNKLK